jgi:hypothetical protein
MGVFAIIILAPLAYRLYDTDAPDAVDRMAILTSLALLIVGVSVLLLGVYAALLEIRGRLGPRTERRATPTAGEETTRDVSIIRAIAKFRLLIVVLLVVGCVPLVAAAWVAQSAVDGQSEAVATPTPRAATRTPSPAPTTAPAP